MLVELGNHSAVRSGVEEHPKVTRVHIPEFDSEFLEHTDHYAHDTDAIVTPGEFKAHLYDAAADAGSDRWPVTNLPGHESLLAIEAGWRNRGSGRPDWVNVQGHPELTPDGKASDIEAFLSELYEVPTLAGFYGDRDLDEAHVLKELGYWTPNGPPGECRGLTLPEIQAVYTVDGRIMNNFNDGGDALQSVMMGTGTAAGATTLTTGQTLVTNATAGHRVYVRTAAGTFVWGNCISNTNAAGASVITVDQWYTPLTPGGTVGTTPALFDWVLVDGGMVSTWFAAIGTGGSGWANTDHTIATSSGSTEYTQAGGTLIRKICPTAVDVSASARTVTLVPVFTANASDVANLPKVVSVAAFFASMVIGFGGAGGPMKFIDAVSPTATIAALNDQLTLTEVISGS